MKTFKQHLEEAKQVGIIYHFTNLEAVKSILEKDFMKTDIVDYDPAISFTRNYKLAYMDKPFRITFDGNKMSNKFKFAPHLYQGDKYYRVEAEERIPSKKGYIKGVKKYIKQIDTLDEDLIGKLRNIIDGTDSKIDSDVWYDWEPVK